MTTHDSESEIAGRLGASLTPSVPRIAVQHRGEQSSGLFDIGAMYAASVEQVMRRARTVREPSVRELAQGARLAPAAPVHAWTRAPDPRRAIEIDLTGGLELEQPARIARARGVGWFGVAVAWLATAALGATVATSLPAHTVPRVAPAMAVVATAPVMASAPPPAEPPSQVAASTAIAVTTLPPAAVQSTLPPGAPDSAAAAAPKKPNVAPHLRTMATMATMAPARTVSPEAAAPVAQPQKAVVPTTTSPSKTASSTSPQATGGSSLEDLMRRAVEADSKHH
jgi:hypothetical protein